jgi:protein-disulfide isomerase
MQKYRAFLIIALVLIAAIVATACLLRSNGKSDLLTTSNSNQQSVASVSPDRKLPAGVVVTLEEFGDYQCPPCGAVHPGLKKIQQDFGPNLNFVFRNMPLTTVHKNALIAAQAAEAARVQSRVWEMHDLLYENQALWSDDINPRPIFIKFAADLGLDAARFTQDMDDKQVQLRIEADKDEAARRGVTGTPTIFIEGRELRPEANNLDGIRKGIELVLRQKAAPSP